MCAGVWISGLAHPASAIIALACVLRLVHPVSAICSLLHVCAFGPSPESAIAWCGGEHK